MRVGKSIQDRYIAEHRQEKIDSFLAEGMPWGLIYKKLIEWETLYRAITPQKYKQG